MDEKSKVNVDDAIARAKEKVNEEVEKHKDEDVDLRDVVGGTATTGDSLWKISYET